MMTGKENIPAGENALTEEAAGATQMIMMMIVDHAADPEEDGMATLADIQKLLNAVGKAAVAAEEDRAMMMMIVADRGADQVMAMDAAGTVTMKVIPKLPNAAGKVVMAVDVDVPVMTMTTIAEDPAVDHTVEMVVDGMVILKDILMQQNVAGKAAAVAAAEVARMMMMTGEVLVTAHVEETGEDMMDMADGLEILADTQKPLSVVGKTDAKNFFKSKGRLHDFFSGSLPFFISLFQ
jgi:hypothetical protein